MKVLLAGYGSIAEKLVEQYSSQAEWHAICRSQRQQDNVEFHYLDLFTPLQQPLTDVDYVIYTATPSTRTEQAYQDTYVKGVENLLNALDLSRLKHFLYVSSTSVYGQNAGEDVDELSPTEPTSFSGQAILAGENLLKQHLPDKSSVIRFGGIYGNKRTRLIRDVIDGVSVYVNSVSYTNRIHEDDCVSLLWWLLERKQAGKPLSPIYVATDGNHASKTQVYLYIAEQLSLTSNVKIENCSDLPAQSGKRCHNWQLKSLGFEFRYPDYRAGYKEMVEQFNASSHT